MNIEKTYKAEIKGRYFTFTEDELKEIFFSLKKAFKEVDTTVQSTPVVTLTTESTVEPSLQSEPVSSPVVTEEVAPQASQPAQSGELLAGE